MKKPVSLMYWTGFFLVLLLLWQLLARAVDNPLLLPDVQMVLSAMAGQLASPQFVPVIASTIGRVLAATALSLVTGILLAVVSLLCSRCAFFIDRFLLLIRSVPNISFIILALFWLDREAAVLMVLILLLMPLIYSSFYQRLKEISTEYRDLLQLYPQPFRVRFRDLYLPELRGTFMAAVTSALSLAFKGGVMAEVLCQTGTGIGRTLQSSRFALDTAGVIGWTVWLLLVTFVIDGLFKLLQKYIADKL